MKTPLSLLSLLALTAVSCQSAAGPEFEAGLSRVSFGGGLSQAATTNNTNDSDFSSVSSLDLDLTAGLFMSECIEVGGNFAYASGETTDEVASTTTTTSNLGLGLYGRYYFSHAEGTHHWLHAGLGMVSSDDGTTSDSGFDTQFGIGHTQFLTDSAALEIGAFYGMNSVGILDTSGIDITAAYSIFW
jgi:hypothetical protein